MGEGTLAAPGALASEHPQPEIQWDAIDHWAEGLAEKEDFFKDEVGLDTKPRFAEFIDGDGRIISSPTREEPLQRRKYRKRTPRRKPRQIQPGPYTWITIIREVGKKGRHRRVEVFCKCGEVFITYLQSVLRGLTTSCGCLHRKKVTTHGMSRSPEYKAWLKMKGACYGPNSASFPKTGAAGIKVCEEWHSFPNFFRDMGRKPPSKCLSRKNQSADFCKENCEWIMPGEHYCRTTELHPVTIGQTTKNRTEWIHHFGMGWQTINDRLATGMSFLEALLTDRKADAKRRIITIDGTAKTKDEWRREILPTSFERHAKVSRQRKLFNILGIDRTRYEWAAACNTKLHTIYHQMNRGGVTFEEAVASRLDGSFGKDWRERRNTGQPPATSV